MMKTKICSFNFGGFLLIVSTAVCASLLISLDAASANGETISKLEFFRAFVAGLIAVGGFFTRRKVEVENDES